MPLPGATGILADEFQSAPALEDGRCWRGLGNAFHDQGFNPRPPWRTGDAIQSYYHWHHKNVSIRARPGGRAMQPMMD